MKSSKLFFKGKKYFKSIPKNKQEEQLFINPNRKSLLKKKNNQIILKYKYVFFSLFALLIIILILFIIKGINNSKIFKNNIIYNSNIKINNSIYIENAKINSEYLKYLRPINETEEEKYNQRLSKHDSVIDKKLFEKRADQLDYRDFCQIALDEKLIDDSKIKYDNKPIISVVVPSYNKKDILIKSIRSIQNQNFKNIEIIIVNDCSTDNSKEVFNYFF